MGLEVLFLRVGLDKNEARTVILDDGGLARRLLRQSELREKPLGLNHAFGVTFLAPDKLVVEQVLNLLVFDLVRHENKQAGKELLLAPGARFELDLVDRSAIVDVAHKDLGLHLRHDFWRASRCNSLCRPASPP